MQKQRITDQNWTIWRPGNKAMSLLCPSNSHLNFLYPVFNAKVPPISIHSQTMNLIPSLVLRLLAHREPGYEANLIFTLLRSAVCGSTLNCHECSLNSLVLTNYTCSLVPRPSLSFPSLAEHIVKWETLFILTNYTLTQQKHHHTHWVFGCIWQLPPSSSTHMVCCLQTSQGQLSETSLKSVWDLPQMSETLSKLY